jgi:hypothetical protein
MTCPKCNNVLPDGSKFCQYCGQKIETSTVNIKKSTIRYRVIIAVAAIVILVLVGVIVALSLKYNKAPEETSEPVPTIEPIEQEPEETEVGDDMPEDEESTIILFSSLNSISLNIILTSLRYLLHFH